MNTKGNFVFNLFLVFGLLAIIVFFFYKIDDMKKDTYTKYIGEYQVELNNAYIDGLKKEFNIQQSAKHSQEISLVKIYNQGGYYYSECGSSKGYSLWLKGSKKCFIDYKKAYSQYGLVYSDEINNYSANYLQKTIPYNITNQTNNLLLIGNKTLMRYGRVVYYLEPKIKVEIMDDLSFVTQTSKLIEDNIDKCNKDIACWNSLKSMNTSIEGNIVYFDIDSGKEIGMFSRNRLRLKFALDFSNNNPLFT